jgi:hypothetical protein
MTKLKGMTGGEKDVAFTTEGGKEQYALDAIRKDHSGPDCWASGCNRGQGERGPAASATGWPTRGPWIRGDIPPQSGGGTTTTSPR